LPEPYVEIGSSDLLVLSSDREGFGNVIVEAMLCGLRVVSTDCGEGVHEILLDDRYGTIVPQNEPLALAQAIEYELLTPHDAQEQIAGAQRFLPKVIAHQFMAAICRDGVK
jgi:glycosyltransferase involved in cell wall biosynthesis